MSEMNDSTIDDILYDAAVALRDHDYISLAEGLERIRSEAPAHQVVRHEEE